LQLNFKTSVSPNYCTHSENLTAIDETDAVRESDRNLQHLNLNGSSVSNSPGNIYSNSNGSAVDHSSVDGRRGMQNEAGLLCYTRS